jgi:hypothetical protein
MWLFLLAELAIAGACCVGATSGTPMRVGECETVTAGLGLGTEMAAGRWDGSGKLANSSVRETSGLATLGLGYRFGELGHITAQLPMRLNYRATDRASSIGGGPGDLSTAVWLDPFTERYRTGGKLGSPMPVMGVGIRAPTGVAWNQSDAELMADVTGRPGASPYAVLGIERSLGNTPWNVSVDGETGRQDRPARLGVGGSIGRYLSRTWTVVGVLRHERTFVGEGTARTSLGTRLVAGQSMRWRAWVGGGADVPIPGLGLSRSRTVEFSGGAMLVR